MKSFIKFRSSFGFVFVGLDVKGVELGQVAVCCPESAFD